MQARVIELALGFDRVRTLTTAEKGNSYATAMQHRTDKAATAGL